MDGMYITSPRRNEIQSVLSRSFIELAEEFLSRNEMIHRFLVRGAIAYGPTLHGSDIDERAFLPNANRRARDTFNASQLNSTRQRLLLSPAMVSAYKAESLAPPFGIYVDASALSIPQLVDGADSGFPNIIWKWWRLGDRSFDVAGRLWPELNRYYDEAVRNGRAMGYPQESAKKHSAWAAEYFREFDAPAAE
jgi:hypothetical protein